MDKTGKTYYIILWCIEGNKNTFYLSIYSWIFSFIEMVELYVRSTMCSWGCQSKSQYWCSWSTSLKGCYLPLFTLRGSQDFFRGGGTVGRLWITKLTKSICQWSDKQSPLWRVKYWQYSNTQVSPPEAVMKWDKKNKPIHESQAGPLSIDINIYGMF